MNVPAGASGSPSGSGAITVASATAIGVGGMMGAGLYTLVGLAAGAAGVWVPVAFLVGGVVAVFDVNVPQEPLSRFEAIVPLILLLMLVCFSLSGFLVRMTTGSLDRLAQAADAIGRNPHGRDVPLAPSGTTPTPRGRSARPPRG